MVFVIGSLLKKEKKGITAHFVTFSDMQVIDVQKEKLNAIAKISECQMKLAREEENVQFCLHLIRCKREKMLAIQHQINNVNHAIANETNAERYETLKVKLGILRTEGQSYLDQSVQLDKNHSQHVIACGMLRSELADLHAEVISLCRKIRSMKLQQKMS